MEMVVVRVYNHGPIIYRPEKKIERIGKKEKEGDGIIEESE